MLKFEKTNLSFDAEACKNALIQYFTDVLHEADEKYLGLMMQELFKVGDGPRDRSARITKWRRQVLLDMKEINIQIAKGKLESRVGVSDSNDEIWRKGVILQKGGGPNYAGPYGRIVWDDDYVGRHPSIVKAKEPGRRLPAKWKLTGKDWMENATRRMETFYKHYLARAESKIPDGFYAQFLRSG